MMSDPCWVMHPPERAWMKLPETFENTFRELLSEAQANLFFVSFDMPRTWGLRVNTLKLSVAEYLDRIRCARETTPEKLPPALSPVPWTHDGFAYDGTSGPGRHPDYHAGLYYLQDPSAMLPAELLNPKPGERVLDCCAAPGGKTVQLAAMMDNQGFLLANDISPKRVKPLRRNLEGLGVACAVVSNEEPARLAAAFPQFFDAILLDVPCSGEGMFRKDETAVRSWERHDAPGLQAIQRSLLAAAHTLLCPGGRLVYSTCTYNPDENERQIAWALEQYPDLEMVSADAYPGGLASGRSDWVPGHPELAGAVRVWPHLANGEGQFAALLRKREDNTVMRERGVAPVGTEASGKHAERGASANVSDKRGKRAHEMVRTVEPAPLMAVEALQAFCEAEIVSDATIVGSAQPFVEVLRSPQEFLLSGTALYWSGYARTCPPERLAGLRLEMPGLYVGDWSSERYEPSAALLHALTRDAARRQLVLGAQDESMRRYLHGETLMREGERGWLAILVDGFPLGWGKQEDGFLKNRYPKGWRML